jgi:phosphopantothenoylcysteine decarboxylase/phosphopantothenate--cysteine ligase
VQIAGPAMGHLASGLSGIGRMVEPQELLGHARQVLGSNGPLAGRRLVITAGGTQEPLDPVRAITNRSSGKQGFALAQAALDRGAAVTLIAGATSLAAADTPVGAQRVDVRTAQEMLAAVLAALPSADGLLMAAAVADFRPAAPAEHKIKKEAGAPQILLEPTTDILAAVRDWRASAGWHGFVLGFAAESRDLLENARHKLQSKRLDMIAANDISATDAGFAVDSNRVTLLYPDGRAESLPLASKAEVAAEILERVAASLPGAPAGAA